MKTEPLISPDETIVSKPSENPEITWARKTLEDYPGTHFRMAGFYGKPDEADAVACEPCALGYLAFVLTGAPNATVAGHILDRLGFPDSVSALFTWSKSHLLPRYAKHSAYAVPKAILLEAFNRVARGERIVKA